MQERVRWKNRRCFPCNQTFLLLFRSAGMFTNIHTICITWHESIIYANQYLFWPLNRIAFFVFSIIDIQKILIFSTLQFHQKKFYFDKWRPMSLSELTPNIFKMELTHLGSEASKYQLCKIVAFAMSNWIISKKIIN